MRHLPAVIAAALALGLSAAVAQDQTATEATEAEGTEAAEAEAEAPPRPADAPETASVEADLAECSAMLTAMSGASTSFVERDQLLMSSGEWLSAASRVAGDGSDIMTTASARAEEWSGKVQSLRFLSPHKPWLEYCGSLAAEHGLDPAPFSSRLN